MTINAIFRAPERCLCLALMMFCLGIMIVLPHASAFSAPAQTGGGDPTRGQELFQKRCTSCHNLDREKEGPRLRGVFGRKSGSIASFTYSEALKSANKTWDANSLDKWLTDTDKFIPDNDMNLSLKNADERADIIAYLKQVSDK
jgi:cytochrome c